MSACWGCQRLDRRHISSPCKRPRTGYRQVAPAVQDVQDVEVQDVDRVVRGLCVFLNAAANISREEIRLTTVCQALWQHYIDSGLRTIIENAKLQAQNVNRAMVRPDWEWQIALRRVPPIKSDNLTSAYHQLYHQRTISAPQIWCRTRLYRVHWIMVDIECTSKELSGCQPEANQSRSEQVTASISETADGEMHPGQRAHQS